MSIFSFLGQLFTSIFSATRRAWNHLPPAIQDQIKNGSGAVNILQQYIGQDPKLTIATLQANLDINLELLYSSLSVLANYWKLPVPTTLEELIVVIQGYLKTLQDSEWDRVLSTGAQVIADVLTGSATPFGIISTVMEFVYNEFFRGKEIKVASLPVTTSAPLSAQMGSSPNVSAVGGGS
jgi:hypothetical protein